MGSGLHELNLGEPEANLKILLRFAELRTSRFKFDKPCDLGKKDLTLAYHLPYIELTGCDELD
jgi:hypothetical protein